MLTALLIAAWVIDAAALLFVPWRMASFVATGRHGAGGLLAPVGVLALLLALSGWFYHVGRPGKALVTAAAPVVMVGGGYCLILLVSILGKARWN